MSLWRISLTPPAFPLPALPLPFLESLSAVLSLSWRESPGVPENQSEAKVETTFCAITLIELR